MYSGSESGKDSNSKPLSGRNRPHTLSTRSGSGYGRGLSSTPLTTLKIAVLAPMPNARVSTIVTANPGRFNNILTEYRTSCAI